jgi:hypothetical protein
LPPSSGHPSQDKGEGGSKVHKNNCFRTYFPFSRPLIVVIRYKDHLPVVPSLDDMMRVIGDYDPCAS